MVRPEPDQPLDQADVRIEGGVVTGFGFGEINSLRQRDHSALAYLGRRLLIHVRRHGVGAIRHFLLLLLLFARFFTLLPEFESGACRRAAAEKFGIVDLSGAGF
jgi:hypothetical protein